MPWDGPLLQLQERDCLVPPSPACCSRTSWSQAAHSNRQSAGVAPSFAESTISSHLPSMLQLQLLRVDLGGLVDGYTTAGQFIQVRVGEKKAGFFAIASPPDKENRGPVEVLVKDNAPETTAHDLCRIEPGTLELLQGLARSCLQAVHDCARWVQKGAVGVLRASQAGPQQQVAAELTRHVLWAVYVWFMLPEANRCPPCINCCKVHDAPGLRPFWRLRPGQPCSNAKVVAPACRRQLCWLLSVGNCSPYLWPDN